MKKTLAKVLALALCAVLLVTGTVFITLAYLQAQTGVIKNTFTTAGINLKLDEATVDQDGNALIYYRGEAPVEYLDTDDTEDLTSKTTEDVTQATRWNATANTNSNGDLTVLGNKYLLVPKKTYVKDPTITVEESTPCFVVIAVKNTIFTGNLEDVYNNDIEVQMAKNGWRTLDASLKGENEDDPFHKLGWGDEECKLYYYCGVTTGNDITIDSHPGDLDSAIVRTDNDPKIIKIFENFTIPNVDEITVGNNASLEVIAIAVQSEGFVMTDEINTVPMCIRNAFKEAGFLGENIQAPGV